jgi:hypothetical protein
MQVRQQKQVLRFAQDDKVILYGYLERLSCKLNLQV